MRRTALLIFLLLMSAAVISGCRLRTASTVPYPAAPLVVYETTAVGHPDVIAPPGPPSIPATPYPLPKVPKTRVDAHLSKAFIDRVASLYRAGDVLGLIGLLPPDAKTAKLIGEDYEGDAYFSRLSQWMFSAKATDPAKIANWATASSWEFDTGSYAYVYDSKALPYVVYRVFFALRTPQGGKVNTALDLARDRKTGTWYYLPLIFGPIQRNLTGNPNDPYYDDITWHFLVAPR
ncbi:MAG: hypothetical protein WC971_06370 [Coriobacteriia bacterium]